jgi:hypothetical protein
MCLEDSIDNPENMGLITPPGTSINIRHPSTLPTRSAMLAMQSTGPVEDNCSVWDLDDLEPELQPSQPRGKKRKTNGQGSRAATVIDIDEESNDNGDPLASEQLRTPHGQRTSNICFTRTNTVKKIFAPAASRAIPTMPGAMRPNGAARAPGHNQASDQQPSTGRQRTQQTSFRARPNHRNANARNRNGNRNPITAANFNRGQTNNSRGGLRGSGG